MSRQDIKMAIAYVKAIVFIIRSMKDFDREGY